jgi:HEAT repeat protein
MSDTRRRRTYYLPVTKETYRPRDGKSKTHVFVISLQNEVTEENIGTFVADVTSRQPKMSAEDVSAWIETYKQENPLLYQDLDQIETFLQIMRGSDQDAQVKAKYVIKEMFESGALDSARLVNGLLAIFQNCRDRITQNHVLETLVFLKARQVIPDIVKQISNNLSLPEYQKAHPEHRSPYTSFLFAALVQLEARSILRDIRVYFQHPESHLVQEAVFACGELRLKGGASDILRLLSHPDANVRIIAAQALAKYGHKYIVEECVTTLRRAYINEAVHGAIYVLAYFKKHEHIEDVIRFVNDDDPHIRQAVSHYLGQVNATQYAYLLIDLMVDNDLDVRSQACLSFIDNLSLDNNQKEKLVLPKLEAAFDQGEEIKVASLLGVVQRCGSDTSKPLLLRIYWEDDGVLVNHIITDANGHARGVQPIDLKTCALEILKRFDIAEIRDDIVRQISHSGEDVLVRYISTAWELKLPEAFDAITSIRDEYMLNLSGFIVTGLIELDRDRAANWALSEIEKRPSFPVCLVCCSIFELMGLQKQVANIVHIQLWGHFQEAANRLVPGIYRFLREYEVVETIPVIISDLNADRYGDLEEYQALLLIDQMLQTLGVIGGQQGHDFLIGLLSTAGLRFKMQILHLLSSVADEPSMEAIKKCLYDPDSDVRELANRLIE